MSRTILISAVLLAMVSALSTGNGVNAQDGEEKDRKDKDKKAHVQTDPFGAPDPFGDKDPFDPFSDDLPPTKKQPAAEKPKVPESASKPTEQPTRAVSGPFRYGEDAIQKALAEPTSMEFLDTPLSHIVDYLKDLHDVPIHIDRRALDDVGLDADIPVTFTMKSIPLRSALNLMLDQFDLTWTIFDDVLVITTEEEAEIRLVTKVYDVSDLVFPMSDKPYGGQALPTTREKAQAILFGSGAGQGKSNVGGSGTIGGGGMGMGMFNVADALGVSVVGPLAQQGVLAGGGFGGMGLLMPGFSSNLSADMDGLISIITGTVRPMTWDEVGGPGSVVPMRRMLVISQTLHIHREIADLLETLRAANRAVPTVVVDARWVLLESESRDPVTLERLSDAATGARGRIACTSGQLVHLTAGERRAVAVGAVPVIGSGIGYQPTIVFPNIGIVLEVRPTVASDRKTAVLDIRNIVTQWREPGPPIRVGGYSPPYEVAKGETETVHQPASGASASVDRVRMPTQQFAATMRVPIGQPVLIGGMTLSPTEGESKELYLVIETSIAE